MVTDRLVRLGDGETLGVGQTERVGDRVFDVWATINGILGHLHDDEERDENSSGFKFLLMWEGTAPSVIFGIEIVE